MKKQYFAPIALKVNFEYEKVTASSGEPCYWGSYYQGRFCFETYQPSKNVSTFAIPECGWVVEFQE